MEGRDAKEDMIEACCRRECDVNCMKDRRIHGVSNVWSTAQ